MLPKPTITAHHHNHLHALGRAMWQQFAYGVMPKLLITGAPSDVRHALAKLYRHYKIPYDFPDPEPVTRPPGRPRKPVVTD